MERVAAGVPVPDIPVAMRAMAAGFQAAGVRLVTNHPGFHSQVLHALLSNQTTATSASERIAYSVAWGASIGGWRSVVTFKNVGLNNAADPFLNSLLLDLNAALVVVVFDDTDVEQSQMRIDSRHYQSFLGGVWLEPGDATEAFDMALQAVNLSEKFSSPVVLRCTNRLLASRSPFTPQALDSPMPPPRPFKRSPSSFVVHPAHYHAKQAASLSSKQAAWNQWSSRELRSKGSRLVPDEEGNVHIVVGAAAPPLNAPSCSILRLPMLPVPAEKVLEQACRALRIVVHEHGDPIVRNLLCAVPSAGSPLVSVSSGTPHPNRAFHNSNALGALFKALRAFPNPIVIGDVGGFTMDPARSLDACLCYGSAVAVATGVSLACPGHTVSCVIGDGGWLHDGKNSLSEAISRGNNLLIVVLDNGGCQSTGGQRPPGMLSATQEGLQEAFAAFPGTRSLEWREKLIALASEPGIKILHLTLNNSN